MWRSSVGGNISEHLEISWWIKPWNHTGFPLRCTPLQDQVLPPHMMSRRPENRETPNLVTWVSPTLRGTLISQWWRTSWYPGCQWIFGDSWIASHLPPMDQLWTSQQLGQDKVFATWDLGSFGTARKMWPEIQRSHGNDEICCENLLQFVNSDKSIISSENLPQRQ